MEDFCVWKWRDERMKPHFWWGKAWSIQHQLLGFLGYFECSDEPKCFQNCSELRLICGMLEKPWKSHMETPAGKPARKRSLRAICCDLSWWCLTHRRLVAWIRSYPKRLRKLAVFGCPSCRGNGKKHVLVIACRLTEASALNHFTTPNWAETWLGRPRKVLAWSRPSSPSIPMGPAELLRTQRHWISLPELWFGNIFLQGNHLYLL